MCRLGWGAGIAARGHNLLKDREGSVIRNRETSFQKQDAAGATPQPVIVIGYHR